MMITGIFNNQGSIACPCFSYIVIQRIPRYIMLLNDLHKQTSGSNIVWSDSSFRLKIRFDLLDWVLCWVDVFNLILILIRSMLMSLGLHRSDCGHWEHEGSCRLSQQWEACARRRHEARKENLYRAADEGRDCQHAPVHLREYGAIESEIWIFPCFEFSNWLAECSDVIIVL